MTNDYRNLSLSNLPEIRRRVYDSYDSLLRTGTQPIISFPYFHDNGERLYCSAQIDDKEFKGKTYLCGKIISKEYIGEGLGGVILITEEEGKEYGIELFEHYTQRSFKPLVCRGETIIINKTALEKNPKKLEGYTIEEVIGLNFELFPIIINNARQLSPAEDAMTYLKLWAKYPIFFHQ